MVFDNKANFDFDFDNVSDLSRWCSAESPQTNQMTYKCFLLCQHAQSLKQSLQNCFIYFYADDTVLYASGSSFDLAIANVQPAFFKLCFS